MNHRRISHIAITIPTQILELAKEPNVPQTQKQGRTKPTILIFIFIPG